MSKTTKTYKPKSRCWHALNALTRKVWRQGCGKKAANKKACRGKVSLDV